MLGERAVLTLDHVVGGGSLQYQTLEERSLILHIQVVTEGNVVILLGTGDGRLHEGHGVTVLGNVGRIVIRVVAGGSVDRTGGQEGVIHGVLRSICRGHLLGGHVDGALEGDGEVRGDLGGEVGRETVAVVVTGVGAIDSVLVGEVAAQVVSGLLVTTTDGNVVNLGEGVALEDGIPPGEVLISGIAIAIMGDFLVGISGGGVLAVVAGHLVVHLHIGGDVHFLGKGGRHTEGEGVGVGHAGLSDLTFLGGHEDNTILGTQTVDGSGSILQDGDGLNVVRVQFCESSAGGGVVVVPAPVLTASGLTGNTIDDHERGAVTTEGDVLVEPAHSTGVLTDLQTGNLTLQGGNEVTLLGGGDVLGLDVGDGAGEGSLLLGTVTHDHGLFQFGGFLLEGDVHRRRSHFDAKGLITHCRNFEFCSGRNADGEITVEVAGCAVGGADLEDGRTDDGLLLSVKHRTLHREVLGGHKPGAQDKSQTQGYEPLEEVVGSHT